MPNILIVGFDKNVVENVWVNVAAIVCQLGLGGDAIVTIVPADTKWCDNPVPAPYLVVRDTDLEGARKIANALHRRLNLDIEYEKIAGFLAAVPSAS
ncbi:MAG: hypothetical protein ABSF56_03560 [Minisyncoccia bacterium]|jgi:hypothetical protein